MKYNQLKTSRQKKASRSGRGIAGGRGKTAGRGTKGQGSRKSGGVRPGFEGGQMPIYMRIPKVRGFKSLKRQAETVHTGQLDSIKGETVDNDSLAQAGLISSPFTTVKLIRLGELKSKKSVKLQSASQGAVADIEKAGGSFSQVAQIGRTAKKSQLQGGE